MSHLAFLITQAFASQPCFDLVDRFAAENCLSYSSSYEVDMGDGPVITYQCDLGNDLGQETFAIFSLSTDADRFFEHEPTECAGGDLWVDPGDPCDPSTGVDVSWLSWTMFHEWDDQREAGEMSHLDDWLVEQSIMRLHHGDSQQ